MAVAVFCFIIIIVNIAGYWINRHPVNIISVITIPYIFIVVLNNYFLAERLGFYKISDEVIRMLGTSVLLFSTGSLLADCMKKIRSTDAVQEQNQLEIRLLCCKSPQMRNYVFVVECITFVRFLFVIARHGIAYINSSAYEGYLTRGIPGHIFLTIYPLIPILFLNWLHNRKDISYLLVSLSGIFLYFLTMIKYHSIGIVVLIYIFISLEDRRYVRKGLAVLAGAAAALFVGNYVLSFTVYGTASKVTGSYYMTHLWDYIAGSLIYDNYIFTDGIRVGVSAEYKLGSFFLTPLRFFLNILFGVEICPHAALPFRLVGMNGERGNVVDMFGYLYPSMGHLSSVIYEAVILVLIGAAFTIIYNSALHSRGYFLITLSVFLTFFCFFSFFGTFYVNLPPWEILFWSFIMPKLFDRRIIIKWRP